MLRTIRIILAALTFTAITLLFLDFTGATHAFLGWLAKIQLLPAILSANVVVIVALVLLTLIFGRIYCSIICPLGIMQDIIAWAGKRGKKKNRFKYSYSKPKTALRVVMLVVMVIAVALGISAITALLAPYSAYGRIASSFFAPIYALVNNLFAAIAERAGSYAFYPTEVWGKALSVVIVAGVTLVALAILAWRNGRTYCSTICPVGTVLGFLAKYSLFKPVIDTEKCTKCTLCERGCKAACIDSKNHEIDRSRCVACMDCISICTHDAIHYKPVRFGVKKAKAATATAETSAPKASEAAPKADTGRRAFLTAAGLLAVTAAEAKVKRGLRKTAGGRVTFRDNPAPESYITPPGSGSHLNMHKHCIACQLCVQACPNNVLVPSDRPDRFMQPELRYNDTYCRPECTACSEVCPTGAISKITKEQKSSIQIGHAVWHPELCLAATEGVHCHSCSRHCPAGAITMVDFQTADGAQARVPAVDTAKCIGCGACQALCPARPQSAIRVEGHENHHII
ncbi:MAG: 4Fe-4S dicluster domain-containing protein [Bacteroidales bacterium]|nr:4Fe-4S dicluster domain-containing protein [Bacteroidales bacterium]